jgi:hypothetical protein
VHVTRLCIALEPRLVLAAPLQARQEGRKSSSKSMLACCIARSQRRGREAQPPVLRGAAGGEAPLSSGVRRCRARCCTATGRLEAVRRAAAAAWAPFNLSSALAWWGN